MRISKRHFLVLASVSFALAAVVPLAMSAAGHPPAWLSLRGLAILNLCGWSVVLALILTRRDLTQQVMTIAGRLGVETRFRSLESIFTQLLDEIDRKNSSLSIRLIEGRIATKEELSRTLEKVAAHAFKLLDAESAEIALFNSDSGMYHSSFVVGKPFRTSAQAMLSGASVGEDIEVSPDVLVQPVSFAGTVFGSLRVGLKKGVLPSMCDQEIMRLLALQSSLALINAQYNEELVRMKRASEESIKAKTGFLANLSHEVRGPLSIMLNAVELVLDGLCGGLSPDQLETLGMVRQNGNHLLELINDVLDYAKVEAGRMTPDPVDIPVNELLRDITNVVRTQADGKSHELLFTPAAEALGVVCDRRHIRQMLINLLTNAIKYTPDGGKIEVWAERAPGNKIKLNIRDNGVGIAQSQRTRVFEAFERIANSYSMTQSGAGLGLALTRRLAEVNGGLVDFSSAPGQGTHFWLVLSAAEMNEAHCAEPPAPPAKISGKGCTVLLAGLNSSEQQMLQRYLKSLGFQAQVGRSRSEIMNALQAMSFQLLILDNDIVDGCKDDLIDEIRRNSLRPELPIVLLSSKAFVFDVERYLKSGIDRCLIKPVPLNELAVVCRRLIDGGRGPDQGEERHPRKRKATNPKVIRPENLIH